MYQIFLKNVNDIDFNEETYIYAFNIYYFLFHSGKVTSVYKQVFVPCLKSWWWYINQFNLCHCVYLMFSADDIVTVIVSYRSTNKCNPSLYKYSVSSFYLCLVLYYIHVYFYTFNCERGLRSMLEMISVLSMLWFSCLILYLRVHNF